MSFLIGLSAALLAAIAPASFPDTLENLAGFGLPDSRIALVAAFLSDPEEAMATARERRDAATKYWKKKRAKRIGPFLPKNKVILEAWLFDEDMETFRWPIQIFNENVPNVNITMRTFSEERTYLSALEAAFLKDQAPDIIMVKNGWMPRLKAHLAPAPQPLYIPEECYDFFFTFACDAFSESEKTLAIPIFVRSLFLIVNRALLEDDRIVVGDRPSESWKGFMENEQKFRKFQNEGKFFASLDLPSQSKTAARLFGALMAQSGEQRPSEDTVKDAVRFLELLYTYSERKNEGFNRYSKTSVDRFLSGDTAVIFGTEEEYLQISRHFVEERDPQVKVSDIAAVPLPYVDPAIKTTYGEAWGFAVPANAANADTAWAFLTFMAEEENISAVFVRSKKTPSRRAVSEYNTFRDSANMARTPPEPFGTLDFEQKLEENIAGLLEEDPKKLKTREQVIEDLESYRKNYESTSPPASTTSGPEQLPAASTGSGA